jgi:hypothetical protein
MTRRNRGTASSRIGASETRNTAAAAYRGHIPNVGFVSTNTARKWPCTQSERRRATNELGIEWRPALESGGLVFLILLLTHEYLLPGKRTALAEIKQKNVIGEPETDRLGDATGSFNIERDLLEANPRRVDRC